MSTETNQTSTILYATTTDGTGVTTDSVSSSIIWIKSPIAILIWFEIIAACLVYGLGFIGNFLSLIVFCSLDEFRRISTGVLFLLTTIFNTLHLWTLITEFLGVFSVYVYSNAFLQCRLNYFVQNVSRAMSTYLAIGIALDRLIRSEFPLRSRRICTRRNVLIYTFVHLVLFSFIWCMWLLPMITENPTTGSCIFNQSPTLLFFLTQVQVPVRLVIVCILPVIIMTAANIRMLYNMRQSRRRVGNQIDLNRTVTTTNNPGNVRRVSALDRMLLYMVLANVGTFVVTQIPFHIYSTVRTYNTTLDAFTNSLIRALLLIWSSIYFGVAFYLYCLAAPFFREKFIHMSKKLINIIKRRPM